ncbi:MAG: AMP phosphorylase [Candidatus Lokiarchaeota archaeon]|nr:AMP phosphorylase [Candidatus Lokiarchaeota archaeon]
MIFSCKRLGLSSDARVIIIDDDDAFIINAKPGDRVKLLHIKPNGEEGKETVAIINTATGTGVIKPGEVGLYDEIWETLHLSPKDRKVDIQLLSKPRSFEAIKRKVKGKELTTEEIHDIISDATDGALLPIELAAFVIGLEIQGASDREVVDFANAMARSGEILDLGEDVFDKHSTGGVPGNKVSLIIVPIIAAAGLLIPKTSTRAITSPSGTADSMEVLANVAFGKDEVLKILKENNAGIFWGSSVGTLAPADDALIKIEKPLNSDPFPLMIASIISKKMCMGVKKMVLDIPCGKGTKFTTIDDGRKFAIRFKDIAQKIGIEAICLLTSASQPIGHAVGPAIEAREAMYLLQNPEKGSTSLRNKSTELAGYLLEMGGKAPEGKGQELAIEILNSGKALKKMRGIISAQGGNPDVSWEEIKIGPHVAEMKASKSGFITEIDNYHINQIAKIAGCPAAKKSGVDVIFKRGSRVKKGDVIFKIYSDSEERLKQAVKYYNQHPPQRFSGMTIEKI